MSGKTTHQGASQNQEACGVKTGKKQNRGTPYLFIQHNSGCRRLKVKVLLWSCFLKSSWIFCERNVSSSFVWILSSKQCTRERGGTGKSAIIYLQKICEILYSIR
jgi:hypothetical protein